MSPRKKAQAPTTALEINTQELATIGAVSKMADLIRSVRALERAYPGSQARAEAALQRENLAVARAVKRQGQGAKGTARVQAQQETPARIAAEVDVLQPV
jgi:hypothetical protein